MARIGTKSIVTNNRGQGSYLVLYVYCQVLYVHCQVLYVYCQVLYVYCQVLYVYYLVLYVYCQVLSLYLDERRGVQGNTSMRSREFPRAQPKGTPETECWYFPVLPDSSQGTDIIQFLK